MAKKRRKRKRPENSIDPASGLPQIFVERLRTIIPEEAFETVPAAFRQMRPVVFRIHKPGIAPHEVQTRLAAAGLEAEPISWFPGAFILRKGNIRDLQAHGLYEQGFLYIQGLSSLFIPIILDPGPGEKVLDMAAAPGSKTTQIAWMMKGEGMVYANENNRARFFKLKANVERQGFQNIRLNLGRGETLGSRFAEEFDRVLLDAPCSSEGRFSAHDPKSFGYWKPRKTAEMARKQRPLILSAFSALKPGGSMVYATCTFAPEENEGVLSWALQKFGEAAALEPVKAPFDHVMPALAAWEGRSWPADPALAIRILPDREKEAFFIAKIRKKSSWRLEKRKKAAQ